MLAGWLCWGGTAVAQTSTFPAALEREALLIWLQRETDILPSQVVAVTPQAVTSIVSTFPAGAGPGPRLVIRAEALSQDIFARTGALSWHVSLNADCKARRVKLGETTGYSERNLLGTRRVLREAEPGWRTPEAGTALEHALRAACDAGFVGPFRSSSVRLAQVDKAPAEAAPVASVAPEVRPTPATVATPVPAVAATKPPATKPRQVAASEAPTTRGAVAQLGALASDAAARSLLGSLASRVQDRPTWIEKGDVAGRTWYRAMAGGFASTAEASQFCTSLKASGLSCFVRQSRGG